METSNAVLDVVSELGLEGIPSAESQYYHINGRKPIRGGVVNKKHLVLDLDLHNDLPTPEGSIHWANTLQVLKVKPFDNTHVM